MAEECGKEVRRLEEEKKLLKDRITAIDRDIDQVWSLLAWQAHVPVIV